MKMLIPLIICLLCGCVTTTYRHGDIVVTRSHLFTDEKASFAFVHIVDGSVMVLGNASSNPDQAAIQMASTAMFIVSAKAALPMLLPMIAGLP